jgi:hypothetical protein
MPIKSFRGMLFNNAANTGDQNRIRLSTQDGMRGFRVVKFQAMGITENEVYEATIKLYKVKQDTIDANVDFSDPHLLAAILYGDSTSSTVFSQQTVIFDNEIFNQDIYVTFRSIAASSNMNWYLELEEVELNQNSQAVVTLKDIRSNIL